MTHAPELWIWWDEMRALHAIFQPMVLAEEDRPSPEYGGLDEQWRARVFWPPTAAAYRPNLYHEGGHHHEDVCSRQGWPEVRREFWAARGFLAVKTLDQAYADWAAAGYPWNLSPGEMYAESFMTTYIPEALERTETFGVPIDRARMSSFYAERGGQTFMPRYISPDIPITTDANGNWSGWLDLVGLKPNLSTVVQVSRIGLAGIETRLPSVEAQANAEATRAFVMLKGDEVRGGQAYIKLLAVQ